MNQFSSFFFFCSGWLPRDVSFSPRFGSLRVPCHHRAVQASLTKDTITIRALASLPAHLKRGCHPDGIFYHRQPGAHRLASIPSPLPALPLRALCCGSWMKVANEEVALALPSVPQTQMDPSSQQQETRQRQMWVSRRNGMIGCPHDAPYARILAPLIPP